MKSLHEKLAAVQGRLKAPKNQRNNFGKYNYRSCEDILEAVKPLLNEYGLVLTLTDKVHSLFESAYVEATSTITDGKDQIQVSAQAGINPDKKGMDIAQSFGSSSSYARKYSLNGLFLIDDTKDADATNTHGKTSTSNKKELLTPKHPKFENVKNYILGGGNIKQVEDKYTISDAAKIQLVNS